MRFTLYNASNNGTVFGTLTNTATGVSNGLFTATLDFGGVFNGSNYWLEIAARTNGVGAFTALSPRQPILPTPHAIYSANAASAATAITASSANSVSAANIIGTVQLAQLPGTILTNNQNGVTLSGTFTGNGAGLTDLNAAQLASGTVADARLSANAALRSGGNTFSGNQIFTGSNVGIGTTSPDAKLHVAGALKIADGSEGVGKVLTSDAAGLTSWVAPVGVAGSGTTGLWTKWTVSGAIGNALASDDGTSASILAAWAGQVSISGGPSQFGNAHVSIYGGNYHYVQGQEGVRRGSDVRIYGGGTEYGAAFGGNVLIAAGIGSHFNGWDDGYIQLTGLTGIGTTARPTAGLELNGTLKITDGSQGAGKILTSDANGLASWQAAVGGLDTNNVALLNGSNTFTGPNNFTSGNVGIGTTNPVTALDVNGTVTARGTINALGGLIIESRTSDPTSPATGQVWIRTDLP